VKTRVAQVLGNRATVVARIMHHLEAGTRAELATAKGEEDVAARSGAVDEGEAMIEAAEEVEVEVLLEAVSTTRAWTARAMQSLPRRSLQL
jgi:hypothetical protein